MAKFKPGQSGNPGGRPKHSLAKKIARETQGGKELIAIALEIARESSEKAADRLAALQLLMSYSYQKPATASEVTSTVTATVEPQLDLSKLTTEELEALYSIQAKALGETVPPLHQARLPEPAFAVVVDAQVEPVEPEPVQAEEPEPEPEPGPVPYEQTAECIDLQKRLAERRRMEADRRNDQL